MKEAWEDRKNRVAMARAFAGHPQIVSAILKYKGDNNYLSEKGGLSFGICKTFIPDQSGEGVIPVESGPSNEADTLTGNFLMEHELSNLKYKTPSLDDVKEATLTPEMIQMLHKNMDKSKLSDELRSHWDLLYSSFEDEHQTVTTTIPLPIPTNNEFEIGFDDESDV